MQQTPEPLLQAVNEQTGFVVEQHHANSSKPAGRFLWKSAKYVDRICAVVDQAKRDDGSRGFGTPTHFDVLKPLSAKLLDIKKKVRHEVARSERARRTEVRPMPAV